MCVCVCVKLIYNTLYILYRHSYLYIIYTHEMYLVIIYICLIIWIVFKTDIQNDNTKQNFVLDVTILTIKHRLNTGN